MQSLNIPVPPQLEAAIGYAGDAPSWFAAYWEPCGNEACYDDGHCSGTGNWSGYLAWTRHPAVALELARALGRDGHLGSSDAEATYWLLIDRLTRRAYLAPALEARRVLHEQWPDVGPVVMSQQEFAALVGEVLRDWQARPMPTMEEITARMQEQRRLEQEMVAWLDATPQAAAGRETIRQMTEDGGKPGETTEEKP